MKVRTRVSGVGVVGRNTRGGVTLIRTEDENVDRHAARGRAGEGAEESTTDGLEPGAEAVEETPRRWTMATTRLEADGRRDNV
ncbi:hypothetical protein J4732_01650 [Serratia marcescens]|uniref:Uncharacterized protein n=1 Tax=Serratia marcescens TaxID=615 RepID=A0A939NR39_SERMA|nr:hypothetical protein [Serratia marcescens]